MDSQKINYMVTLFLLMFLSFPLFSQGLAKKNGVIQSFNFGLGGSYEFNHKTSGLSGGIEYHQLFPNRFIFGIGALVDFTFPYTKYYNDFITDSGHVQTEIQATNQIVGIGAQLHFGVCIVKQKKWNVSLIFPNGIYYQIRYSNFKWVELGKQMSGHKKRDELGVICISGLKINTEYKMRQQAFGLSLMVEPILYFIKGYALAEILPVLRAQMYYKIKW